MPIGIYKRTDKEIRFDSYVKKIGKCWIWTGSCTRDGYGQFSVKFKKIAAHRMSYQIYNGDIPEKMCILHSCDNKKCVNPNHLRIGTKKDNRNDADIRGRSPKGETHGMSKIKDADIFKIKEMYASGCFTQTQISKKFKISQGRVSQLIK